MVHRAENMHGGIASKLNQGILIIVFRTLVGLVFLARSTMLVVLSAFPSTLFTPFHILFFLSTYTYTLTNFMKLLCSNYNYGAAGEALGLDLLSDQILWKLIRLFPSRLRFGSG